MNLVNLAYFKTMPDGLSSHPRELQFTRATVDACLSFLAIAELRSQDGLQQTELDHFVVITIWLEGTDIKGDRTIGKYIKHTFIFIK